MPQLTPSQARVVDPILSQHARGYRQGNLIARALFPLAPVSSYGGQVIEFGKEAFRLYNSKRAPGAKTQRIQFGYAGKPYSIVPSALDAPVPRELQQDATKVPGINLGKRAVNLVLRGVNVEHEYSCAQIARNAANYDSDHKIALVGADRWTSPTSTPVADVAAAREAIRASVGVYPNMMEISPKALSALKVHPDLIDRAAITGIKVVTVDLLKTVFEIPNIVVGEATVATGSADTLGDIWGTDVILAFVSLGSDADSNSEEPSYGYTYLIEGHPMVEVPWWDHSCKSWVYGVSFDNTPVLSGMTAGYLIQNAGSPAA